MRQANCNLSKRSPKHASERGGVCLWPSPTERLTAGPYLPPGAAILLRLLEQAVILYEAIFTRFPAVGDSVTGVSVQQLVGGALRHVRRPTAAGYFPT